MMIRGGFQSAPRVQADVALKFDCIGTPRLVKRHYTPSPSERDPLSLEFEKQLTARMRDVKKLNTFANRPYMGVGASNTVEPVRPLGRRTGKTVKRPANFKPADEVKTKLVGQLTHALDQAETLARVAETRAEAVQVLTHAMEHVKCWMTVRVLAGALARVHERENSLTRDKNERPTGWSLKKPQQQ